MKDKQRITKKKRRIIPSSIPINGTRAPMQNGWIRVKIYGNAYERGFAHGYLLAKEIQEIVDAFGVILTENSNFKSYKKYKNYCRENIRPVIVKEFPEFFEEIKGISDGAMVAGYKNITTNFIIAWNALLSTYTIERCSSFISIQSGNIIMSHNTQTDFITGQTSNIIMEICPSVGNRMIMQMSPGFICSGMDWFMIENGIVGCESTIGNINYTPKFGAPYFCRIRKAMQYGNSLEDYERIMLENNAGDYPCTWLLGDTKKKEIMQFEIGLKYHSTIKKREGAFYGMNSAHDETIRKKETDDKEYGDTKTTSGARNMRLHYLLYEKYAGKMTVENAKKIIADHYDVYLDKETDGNSRTICKHTNLDSDKSNKDAYYPFGCTDAKIIDTKMAKTMSFLGRFGNGCGTAFHVKSYMEKHPKYKKWAKYLKNIPSYPWTKIDPI